MEEGKDSENLVLVPRVIVTNTVLDLEYIRDNIRMGEHHTLGQAGSPRAIRQERQILAFDLARTFTLLIRFEQLLEMRRLGTVRLVLAQQHNITLQQTSKSRSLDCNTQQGLLRHNHPRTRVLEHEGQVFGAIAWVCWRDDAACIQRAVHYQCVVDVIGREDAEDIALLPVPAVEEGVAEGFGSRFYLGVGVSFGIVEGAVDDLYNCQ